MRSSFPFSNFYRFFIGYILQNSLFTYKSKNLNSMTQDDVLSAIVQRQMFSTPNSSHPEINRQIICLPDTTLLYFGRLMHTQFLRMAHLPTESIGHTFIFPCLRLLAAFKSPFSSTNR